MVDARTQRGPCLANVPLLSCGRIQKARELRKRERGRRRTRLGAAFSFNNLLGGLCRQCLLSASAMLMRNRIEPARFVATESWLRSEIENPQTSKKSKTACCTLDN